MKQIKSDVQTSKAAKLRAMGGSAHSDEAADRSLVKQMVKPEARTGHAAGGAAKSKSKPKGKGKTQVNVIVAPRGGDRPVPVPVPVRGAATAAPGPMPSRAPALPPVAAANPGTGGAAPNLGALAGPRPVPPMKKGGAVKRASGGAVKMTAGAGTGEGRLEKIALQKRGGK